MANPLSSGFKLPTDAQRYAHMRPRLHPYTVGWLAQWQEMLTDPEQKIARPRQIYIGHDVRDFLAIEKRGVEAAPLAL
jgi:hypothetical protein